MPAGTPHPHPRHDRRIVVDELQHMVVGQRLVVLGEVAASGPLVRVHRIVELAAPDHVLRAGKPRTHRTIGRPFGESAGMVEMQVRGQHDVDRVHRRAGRRDRMLQVEIALEPVDVGLLGRHLVARSGVDEHGSRAAYEQAAHRHPNTIALVGGRFLLPECLRNHPEHRPAIEVEKPVGHGHELDVAELNRLRPLGNGPTNRRLLELHEHALGARRVDERNARPLCPGPGLGVDEPDVPPPKLGKRRTDVVDAKRDVMESGPALLEKSGDR